MTSSDISLDGETSKRKLPSFDLILINCASLRRSYGHVHDVSLPLLLLSGRLKRVIEVGTRNVLSQQTSDRTRTGFAKLLEL